MRTNKTEKQTQEPTTIETSNLDSVTGGCAACGNAACQPGQQQQQVPTQLPLR